MRPLHAAFAKGNLVYSISSTSKDILFVHPVTVHDMKGRGCTPSPPPCTSNCNLQTVKLGWFMSAQQLLHTP